jgi:SAM-dependent methyltransferase
MLDLETFPWPWPDGSIDEIKMIHVLEHLGQSVCTFNGIIREIYRICRDGAHILIVVPHPRHDFFLADPTHVRPILEETIRLLSRKENLHSRANGYSNSCLAFELGVDFELDTITYNFDQRWIKKLQQGTITAQELHDAALERWNVIESLEMNVRVIKS